MPNEKLESYPLSPMVRREFLKRASMTGLILGIAPQTTFGQTDSQSLLVRGGLIVTSTRQYLADVRVGGGKITEIGPNLAAGRSGEEQVIDARGMLVLPGGIDPHVHLPGSVEDILSGSETALAGGITTFGTMTFPRSGQTVVDAVERIVNLIPEQAIVDVFLHPGLRDFAEGDKDRLLDIYADGHTSVKLQTVRPGWDLNAPEMLDLVRASGQAGAMSLIHCEDYPIVAAATDALMAAGKTSARYWAEARPVLAEVVAVQRVVALCEYTGAPVYVVHLSSKRALDACREARQRGLPVYVETRPTYLHMTDALYQEADPGLYIANPPLRSPEDVEAMWRGLTDGEIDTLGSDHSVLMRAQKADPSLTLRTLRPGFSNLEMMLPMLHSQGVVAGRISLERFVDITSTAPARLFGLYPTKGTIQVGSDADLTVWDPAEERTIRATDLHSRCDFSPYEGEEVTGWPRMTIRRGAVAYQNGEIKARAGTGRLLKRGPSQPLDWVAS
jgi:dihydropyrimidinase